MPDDRDSDRDSDSGEGFEEEVREDAENRIWSALRTRTNDAVERLGLANGALPDRRE